MKGGTNKSFGMLALFLITGAVIGGILGEAISESSTFSGLAPFLIKQYPIFDVPPIIINLYVIKLVVGFALQPNLISILGMVAAIFIFRQF